MTWRVLRTTTHHLFCCFTHAAGRPPSSPSGLHGPLDRLGTWSIHNPQNPKLIQTVMSQSRALRHLLERDQHWDQVLPSSERSQSFCEDRSESTERIQHLHSVSWSG